MWKWDLIFCGWRQVQFLTSIMNRLLNFNIAPCCMPEGSVIIILLLKRVNGSTLNVFCVIQTIFKNDLWFNFYKAYLSKNNHGRQKSLTIQTQNMWLLASRNVISCCMCRDAEDPRHALACYIQTHNHLNKNDYLHLQMLLWMYSH